jgi:hypothetical protein
MNLANETPVSKNVPQDVLKVPVKKNEFKQKQILYQYLMTFYQIRPHLADNRNKMFTEA